MVWIESQTSIVITVLVFSFCYLVAAMILAAVVVMSRWRFGRALKAATPGVLSPLGTIAGHLIELSEQAIAPIQWIVIFTLDGLILLTLAVVHLDSRSAAVASTLALSTAFAVTLILLIVHDRPFVSGCVTLQPLMHEIRLDRT